MNEFSLNFKMENSYTNIGRNFINLLGKRLRDDEAYRPNSR